MMTLNADGQKARRREEALLLVDRTIRELNQQRELIAKVMDDSLDEELMARSPSHVSDNLSGSPLSLMVYDLVRLTILIREGL